MRNWSQRNHLGGYCINQGDMIKGQTHGDREKGYKSKDALDMEIPGLRLQLGTILRSLQPGL